MIKTLSTASLALMLAAGAAPTFAQDATNWTGPYIGIFGGYLQPNDDENETVRFDRNLDGNYGDTVTTTTGANAFSTGFCADAAKGPSPDLGCDDDSSGVEAGVRVGYDYQVGSFVVGGLVEYSGVDVEDSVTAFSTTPAAYVFTRKLDQLAAARLRLGYAAGPLLAYGTGGYAYGKMENSFFTGNTANSFTASVDEDEADGWQGGGGVEYAVAPNLTLTGEYLYTSLEPGDFVVRVGQGAAPATNPFILAPNTTGTDMQRSNGRFGTHSFRIGMNYRF